MVCKFRVVRVCAPQSGRGLRVEEQSFRFRFSVFGVRVAGLGRNHALMKREGFGIRCAPQSGRGLRVEVQHRLSGGVEVHRKTWRVLRGWV